MSRLLSWENAIGVGVTVLAVAEARGGVWESRPRSSARSSSR